MGGSGKVERVAGMGGWKPGVLDRYGDGDI